MAKFESKLIRPEVRNPDGSTREQGVVAWIPKDDPAKAMPVSQKAEELGVWKRAEGEDVESMKIKNKRKMLDDLKRKGLIPATAV